MCFSLWMRMYIYIYICFLGYSIEDTQLEVMDKQTKWGCNGYNNNCSDNIVYYIYIYIYLHVYTYLYILVIRRIYHGAHNLTGCIMGYIYKTNTKQQCGMCSCLWRGCEWDITGDAWTRVIFGLVSSSSCQRFPEGHINYRQKQQFVLAIRSWENWF